MDSRRVLWRLLVKLLADGHPGGGYDDIPAKTRETLEKLDRVFWRLLVQLLADGHPDVSCASGRAALLEALRSALYP